ncbi:putative quinol monooxygenase [Sphingobium phenoxybenzoativorans]|uniref:putative quinol monooxygenase n=1 Tax=Sphingobium phenoxybenzoativorans TaxID=1592790 RepID=UPI0009F7081E|nr:antibiotic biosynthesis monooxygenase [Sphingobium phenoxybenzoativorans]
MSFNDHFVIYARFHLKPGVRERYLELLEVVLRGLSSDPYCKTIFVHTDDEDPDLVTLYEIWAGTRERFDREELAKPYRVTYMSALPDLLASPVEVEWLKPVSEWCSSLINRSS